MVTLSRKTLLPTNAAGTLVMHQGVVVSTSPLEVTLEDGIVPCPSHLLGGYTPVLNDVVCVLDQGGILSVVNKWVS
jgi:hypothetical protein